jgi:RNA polymerase-binding transcription factor DksA
MQPTITMNPSSEPIGAASASTSVPEHWRWHWRYLRQLRDRIIVSQGIHREAAAAPLEAHSMDMADSASDEMDHDLALSLLNSEQDALYEVEAAMRRILEGRYGICEESAEAIGEERLRAVPWTRYCKAAEERMEREGITRVIHVAPAVSLRGSAPEGIADTEDPEAQEPEARKLRERTRQKAAEEGNLTDESEAGE